MRKTFPEPVPGKYFLTEGGIETEIMYKWGYELPEFAMFPLLENRQAAEIIRDMYRRYLRVAAKYNLSALIGGFDYRASPDWGRKLGYSSSALEAANLHAIDFLRDVGAEFSGQIEDARYVGYLGPRGDAYLGDKRMTAADSEDYHATQIATLKKAEVDLVWAVTFNAIEEAVGAVNAAKAQNMPIAISFSLDSSHRLNTGVPFKDAIEAVDRATDKYPAFFSLNCSHPLEFEPALAPGNWLNRVRSIRPNAAKMDKIALCKLGHLEEGDPVELGEMMSSVARRFPHMDIWGGCCGTCETHLAEIAKHLPATPAQTRSVSVSA